MKNLKYLICLIGIILLIGGCALDPVITSSNRASGYNKKIHSLSIIYLGNKLGTDEDQVKQSDFNMLKIAFDNANIKTNLFFYPDLDPDANKNLDAFSKKNSYLMVINLVQITRGDTSNITYTVSVYDVVMDQKVLAANLWVPHGWTKNIYQRFDEMGQVIVDKLHASDLI